MPINLDDWEVIAGGVRPDAAIEFWQDRAKLTWDEAKGLADGAKARAFYVTGLARQDLVNLVSDGIQAALENGETLPQFKERILSAIESQGWRGHRIENIFRTNMQSAYAAGRYKKMQAVKASRPYWQYIAVMDKRVRPSHAVLHEKVYPADHPFWDTNYPPNGFRCRCAVATLSERQVKAQGLTVETEMPKADMWTDPQTGMEYFVNLPGADKGFRNNPFKDWASGSLTADLKGKQPPAGWDYEKLRSTPQAPTPKPDPIEKMLGVKRGAPIKRTDALTHTNPDYRLGTSYQKNCQRCVPAYELRRRGYPVQALPQPNTQRNGTSKRQFMTGSECFKNVDVRGRLGGKPKLTKADLLAELKTLPDGARAGIMWVWPGRTLDGHTIVCEKVGGALAFMDPQNGQIGNHTLGKAHRRYGYSWYRMDNLDLEDAFEWDEIVKAVKK
ncbi:MAG: minor capsid protein [Desulfovibrionaceae bacterium]|nr:minor capsid protein [Desulfovibrionaceae bacterium]